MTADELIQADKRYPRSSLRPVGPTGALWISFDDLMLALRRGEVGILVREHLQAEHGLSPHFELIVQDMTRSVMEAVVHQLKQNPKTALGVHVPKYPGMQEIVVPTWAAEND